MHTFITAMYLKVQIAGTTTEVSIAMETFLVKTLKFGLPLMSKSPYLLKFLASHKKSKVWGQIFVYFHFCSIQVYKNLSPHFIKI